MKKITKLKIDWDSSSLEHEIVDKINELVDRVNEHESDEGSHITQKKRLTITRIFNNVKRLAQTDEKEREAV